MFFIKVFLRYVCKTIYLKMKRLDFYVQVKTQYFCSIVHVSGHGSQEVKISHL